MRLKTEKFTRKVYSGCDLEFNPENKLELRKRFNKVPHYLLKYMKNGVHCLEKSEKRKQFKQKKLEELKGIREIHSLEELSILNGFYKLIYTKMPD